MRRVGKVTKKWLKTRREWIRLNPPNHQNFYECYICRRWVHKDEMELDHIISRTRAPHLRYELSNLTPSHSACNSEKGSKELVKPTNDEPVDNQILEDIWD